MVGWTMREKMDGRIDGRISSRLDDGTGGGRATGGNGRWVDGWMDGWMDASEETDRARWMYVLETNAGRAVAQMAKDSEDYGLYLPKEAQHYGLSKPLEEAVDPSKGFALQYEARQETGLSCGGAYLKFMNAESYDAETFNGDSAYSVMFGPDKCGATNKVHVIFKHKSPLTGEVEEKHLRHPPQMPNDEKVHLYTLAVKDDNTYALSIDGKEEKTGSLFEDFEPPFNPPKEIDDPEDKKPEDWVDDAKMADPEAKKPDDWDEDAPASIPDEDAVKPDDWLDDEPMEVEDDEAVIPEDWDVEEDGDWQPPMIPNPACAEVSGCGEWVRPEKSNPEYKGKWYPPMIDNPAYKGEWEPKQIPNPKYYEDKTPLANIGKIGAVGVEIWTMSSGLVIDNIAVDADIDAVKAFGESFEEKDKSVNTVVEARAEEARKKAESEQDSFNTAGPLGHAQLSALAARLPGFVGDYAVTAMEYFESNPMVYYLAFFALPIIFALLAIVSKLRPSAEQKAKKAQQAKDAKKKKDDDVDQDEDDNDENEPPAKEEEKKTPSKRRVRRSS